VNSDRAQDRGRRRACGHRPPAAPGENLTHVLPSENRPALAMWEEHPAPLHRRFVWYNWLMLLELEGGTAVSAVIEGAGA
jgi:hypothetical protein